MFAAGMVPRLVVRSRTPTIASSSSSSSKTTGCWSFWRLSSSSSSRLLLSLQQQQWQQVPNNNPTTTTTTVARFLSSQRLRLGAGSTTTTMMMKSLPRRQRRQQQERHLFSSSSSLSTTSTTSRTTLPLFHGHSLLPMTTKHKHHRMALFRSPLGALSQFSSSSQPPPPQPRPPSGGGNNSRMAQGFGLIGAATFLFGKTKYLLAALKFTKLASLGSMLVTIGTYSLFFGWPYAAGMVGLIAVHEAGHAAVLQAKGIPFSPAVFVPFVGAVIATKQLPRDAWDDAVIGYGGPALGSVGAAAVAVAAHAADSQLLYALSDFGFMINLFNLLPIGSME
mmetsp:Transcript_20329/g.47280  ORF Transcript_20329/g.47280 Transcript_20329/m.47280 type:complete len:336 (-) Transcript_20329:33-1040(-)